MTQRRRPPTRLPSRPLGCTTTTQTKAHLSDTPSTPSAPLELTSGCSERVGGRSGAAMRAATRRRRCACGARLVAAAIDGRAIMPREGRDAVRASMLAFSCIVVVGWWLLPLARSELDKGSTYAAEYAQRVQASLWAAGWVLCLLQRALRTTWLANGWQLDNQQQGNLVAIERSAARRIPPSASLNRALGPLKRSIGSAATDLSEYELCTLRMTSLEPSLSWGFVAAGGGTCACGPLAQAACRHEVQTA